MAQSGVRTQHTCDSAQSSVGLFLGTKHRVNAVDVAENRQRVDLMTCE